MTKLRRSFFSSRRMLKWPAFQSNQCPRYAMEKKYVICIFPPHFRSKCVDVPIRAEVVAIVAAEVVSAVQTVAIAVVALATAGTTARQIVATTIGTAEVTAIMATVADREAEAIDLDSNIGHLPIAFHAKTMIAPIAG